MKARLGQNDGGQDDRRCLNHSPSSFCPLIVLPVIAWRNGSGLKLTEHQLIAATKSWLNDTDPVALARSVREERNGHERQTKRLDEIIESLNLPDQDSNLDKQNQNRCPLFRRCSITFV